MRREASGLADLSWAGALCTSGQELQLGTSDYGGLTLPGRPVSCREGRTFWKHGLCTFRLVRGLASGSGPPGTFSAFPSWHPWVALRGWRAWGGRSGLAWALLSPPAPTPTPRRAPSSGDDPCAGAGVPGGVEVGVLSALGAGCSKESLALLSAGVRPPSVPSRGRGHSPDVMEGDWGRAFWAGQIPERGTWTLGRLRVKVRVDCLSLWTVLSCEGLRVLQRT